MALLHSPTTCSEGMREMYSAMTSRARGSSSTIRHFHILTGPFMKLQRRHHVKLKFKGNNEKVGFRKNFKIVLTRIKQLKPPLDITQAYTVGRVEGRRVIRFTIDQFNIQDILFHITLNIDPGLLQHLTGTMLKAILHQGYQ